MNERTSSPIDDELLAAYVEGELAASERAAVERALAEDPALKLRVDGLERVRMALSGPVREVEALDLSDAVRARVGKPERSLSARTRAFVGGGLVAAAATLILVSARTGRDAEGEFRAKSSSSASESVERWTGVRVYRARDGAPEPVARGVSPSDGLLFAYTNRADAPFEYLMIFAVDEASAVYWFHPAYERLGDNPRSVAIRAGVVEELLPEVVRHRFPSGRLAMHALFTHRPLGVVEVEAWVEKRRRNASEPLPAGGHVQVLELDVGP